MNCKCCSGDMFPVMDRVYRCGNCMVYFRDYEVNLKEYYDKEYRDLADNDSYLSEKDMQFKRTFIGEITPYLEGTSCLDVGCGGGVILDLIDIEEKYGCDLDPRFQKENVIHCDVFDYPEDRTFDNVLAIDVLEHLLDVEGFVKKMHNLTNNRLILNLPVEREIHNRMPFDGHFWYFSPQSIIELFKDYFTLEKYMTKGRKQVSNGPSLICILGKI